MYFSVYDPNQATMLGVAGGKLSDIEWQSICDDVTRLMEESKQEKKDIILVLLPQPDTERPNATWRRRLGELKTKNTSTRRSLTAIVTPLMLLRGVITAIHWVMPSRPNETTVAFNTFEEAHAWLKTETKKPLDYLVAMHNTASGKLQAQRSA